MTVFEIMSRFNSYTKFFIVDAGRDITNGESVTLEDVKKEYPIEDRPQIGEALEKQVEKLVAGSGCDWVIYCE